MTTDTHYGLTDEQLDMIVTDTEAAITLGCEFQIGKITYRQALEQYRQRLGIWKHMADDILGQGHRR